MVRISALRHLPAGNERSAHKGNSCGFTLLEVLIVLAFAGILVVATLGLVTPALESFHYSQARNDLVMQGNFAMEQMIDAVTKTRRLLLPLADNPATSQDESRRNLLAVTLDPQIDRDQDGYADANNDRDFFDTNGNFIRDGDELENIDEDIPPDNTNDGYPGIIYIDDDNDGETDEWWDNGDMYTDNDEDGQMREDHIDGTDNDGDSSIDEDIPKENDQAGGDAKTYDNDGDGLKSEDWLDPVVFYVSDDGTTLLQRIPVVNSTDGASFTEHVLVQADSISLTVHRPTSMPGERGVLVDITLKLDQAKSGPVLLQSLIRAGGGI
jgi:prepilin-type N-terminal cleavage/methylation domain-containing protein